MIQNWTRYFNLKTLKEALPPDYSVSVRKQIDLDIDKEHVDVIFDPQKNTLRLEIGDNFYEKHENLFELNRAESELSMRC